MTNRTPINILHIALDGLTDTVPVLLAFIALDFGMGAKEAGAVVSLSNAVNMAISLFTVMISRRLGVLPALSAAVLIYALGFVSSAFLSNFYLIVLCFVVGNMGVSVFHNIAFSYIASSTEKAFLGRAMGNFTAIGDLGRIPLASLAGFVAAYSFFGYHGWRYICLVYGVAAALYAGYLLLRRPSSWNELPVKQAEKSRLPNFSILRNRDLALPMLASAIDAFASNQVFVFLPFLIHAKGMYPAAIGGITLGFTAGCFLGKTTLGRLVDEYGARKIFMLSEVMMAGLVALLLSTDHVFIVIVTALALGIVTKGTLPVMQTIIVEPAADKAAYQDIYAINTFARGIGNMAAPVFFGAVSAIAGIQWSFACMAMGVILAAIPILFMKEIDKAIAPV